MNPTDYIGMVVEVKWVDAWSFDPWVNLESLEIGELHCRTYGIVTGVAEQTVAVSSTINAGGDVCGTLMIPIGMVKSIRPILEGTDLCDEQEQPDGSDGPGSVDLAEYSR